MPRGKRKRIAQGIYKDAIGLSAVVRVGQWRKEKRFDKHAPLSELRDWQTKWKDRLRSSGPHVPSVGTFAVDVDRYLSLVRHLAGWVELRSELRAWVALLGTRRRSSISSDVVMQTRNRWLSEKLQPKTINNRVTALNRLWHRLDGRRAPSPCDDIPPLPVHKSPAKRVADDVIQAVYDKLLEMEKAGTLYNAKARARFMVLASTGKRPSEVMRAKPDDVDLDRRVWIPRDGKGGWGPGVYLNDDMLVAWTVFAQAKAWGEYSQNSFVRLLRKAGWPDGVRPYQMRHTVGIGMSEAGVDLSDIQQHMGHKRIETTRTHYVAVLGSRLQDASERLNGRFSWEKG